MNNIVNSFILLLIWGIYITSFVIYVRRRQLSMNMGLNIGIIHMVLVPLSVFATQGSLAGAPGGLIPGVDWALNGPAVLRILGMVGLYGVWDLLRHSLPTKPPAPPGSGPSMWDALPPLGSTHLIVAFFVGAVTLFVVTGVSSGGHWADAKGEFLLTGGTPAMLALSLFAAVRLAALIALAAMYWHDQITLKWFALWMGAMCVVDLYTTGNRIFTLQTLIVITALLMVRGRWFQIGVLSLAALPFGVLMTMFPLIRVYMHRWTGGFALSSATSALGEGYVEAKEYFLPNLGIGEFLMGVTEGININVLVVVVEEFHRSVGLLLGSGILRGFVFWVPRSVWPGKPPTLSILIGQRLLGGESRGVSMGATIFGEFWANFGFLGFVMIPVVLYVINFAISKLIRDTTMRTIAAFIFGYSVVRMPVSDFTVMFLFVIVMLNMTRLGGESNGLRT